MQMPACVSSPQRSRQRLERAKPRQHADPLTDRSAVQVIITRHSCIPENMPDLCQLTTKKQAEARARRATASWGSSRRRRKPSQNHSAMLSPGCWRAMTQILGLPSPGCPVQAPSATTGSGLLPWGALGLGVILVCDTSTCGSAGCMQGPGCPVQAPSAATQNADFNECSGYSTDPEHILIPRCHLPEGAPVPELWALGWWAAYASPRLPCGSPLSRCRPFSTNVGSGSLSRSSMSCSSVHSCP